MDDLITGTTTVEQGMELYQNAKYIMKEAGLNLCKWNSNSKSRLSKIAEKEAAPQGTDSVPRLQQLLCGEEESYSKSCTGLPHSVDEVKPLGIIWDSHTDQLMFKFD